MSTLYERIVAACNERGIKPGFMCDSIGIRRGTISELKNADYNYVSCSKIVAMAGFLKVSCDYLLTGKEFDGITEEERNLLSAYRAAPEADKETVRFMLRNYIPYATVDLSSEEVRLA